MVAPCTDGLKSTGDGLPGTPQARTERSMSSRAFSSSPARASAKALEVEPGMSDSARPSLRVPCSSGRKQTSNWGVRMNRLPSPL